MVISTSGDDATLLYIRLVRDECSEAAVAIEQIYTLFGAHAALRAALIIILLKNKVEPSHSPPDVELYTYVLEEFPEAFPLLEVAITLCMERWGRPRIDKHDWEKWQHSLGLPINTRQDPFEYLQQRLRQHCPITAIKLEQIYQNHGYTAGCYSATALIWLEARVEIFGYRILMELTDAEIEKFTYVNYMHGKQAALHQFNDLLACYHGRTPKEAL